MIAVVMIVSPVVSTIVIVIPPVIVIDVAAAVLPIPLIVAAAVVVRLHPVGAVKRRTCPIAVMPLVMFALRVPVPFDPEVIRAWPPWYAIGSRSGRSADRDAD